MFLIRSYDFFSLESKMLFQIELTTDGALL